MKQPVVYVLASARNGTLYTGVTSDLPGRVNQHKSHTIPGFTRDHRVDRLVWFEAHPTMESAIRRGETDKGMEARVEAAVDREQESAMEGSGGRVVNRAELKLAREKTEFRARPRPSPG